MADPEDYEQRGISPATPEPGSPRSPPASPAFVPRAPRRAPEPALLKALIMGCPAQAGGLFHVGGWEKLFFWMFLEEFGA